jgi:non-heme chloroperoxidase
VACLSRSFDQIRTGVATDRSQYWKDLSMAFYRYNRPGAKISEGVRDSFWLQGMMAGFPATYLSKIAGPSWSRSSIE